MSIGVCTQLKSANVKKIICNQQQATRISCWTSTVVQEALKEQQHLEVLPI